LNDEFGDARVRQPVDPVLLRSWSASASVTSETRPSTRTTKMSTLCTWSVGKGASVSFTTTVPVSELPPSFGKVPSSEHAAANIVLAAISAVIMDRRDMKAFVIERSSSLNRVNCLCRHEIDC
jgi:hypothetical protein